MNHNQNQKKYLRIPLATNGYVGEVIYSQGHCTILLHEGKVLLDCVVFGLVIDIAVSGIVSREEIPLSRRDEVNQIDKQMTNDGFETYSRKSCPLYISFNL